MLKISYNIFCSIPTVALPAYEQVKSPGTPQHQQQHQQHLPTVIERVHDNSESDNGDNPNNNNTVVPVSISAAGITIKTDEITVASNLTGDDPRTTNPRFVEFLLSFVIKF